MDGIDSVFKMEQRRSANDDNKKVMRTANVLQPVIDGLKRERERLEKIAARFEKSIAPLPGISRVATLQICLSKLSSFDQTLL